MKNNAMIRLVTILMVCFLVLFAGYHAFRHFYSSYSTQNTYRYTVYHSVSSQGILLRDEVVQNQSFNGYLRYAVADGEKVKAGSTLAYTYASADSAAMAESSREKGKELSLLRDVVSQMDQEVFQNAAALSEEVDIDFNLLSQAIAFGKYDQLDTLRLNLQQEINRKEILTGDDTSIAARIAALQDATGEVSHSGAITSANVGYFSHCTDGFEDQFGTAQVGAITADELEQMLAVEYPAQQNVIGKVITNYTWYFVTERSAGEAQQFPVDSRVTLTFSGSSSGRVNAQVERIDPDTDGKRVVVTLCGTEINEQTVSRRSTSVLIASQACTGLRFDAELLRVVDGQKGVYVDNGYTVQFKKVDIIYTGNDYYLSRLNYAGEEYLNLFDKLIVSRSDLYDGKPLNEL